MAKQQIKNNENSTVNLMEYLSNLEEYLKQNVKVFLSEISFEQDFFEKKLNYILLEGKTDYKFFKNENFNKFNNNNYYIPLETITEFINEKNNKRNPTPIVKKLIVNILKAKLLCKSFQNNPLFAIVDRDFDDEYSSASVATQGILSNDTHDLETLMLSTDSDVVKKLPLKNLTDENYVKALYMAYQIGCVKKSITNSSIFLTFNTPHDFKAYFNKEKLNVEKYINYLKTKSGQKVNVEQIINQLKKSIKINNQNEITTTIETFKANFPQDAWYIINGHDFTDALQFVLNINLHNPTELLIKSYNTQKFTQSKLFEKMKTFNLVK